MSDDMRDEVPIQDGPAPLLKVSLRRVLHAAWAAGARSEAVKADADVGPAFATFEEFYDALSGGGVML